MGRFTVRRVCSRSRDIETRKVKLCEVPCKLYIELLGTEQYLYILYLFGVFVFIFILL